MVGHSSEDRAAKEATFADRLRDTVYREQIYKQFRLVTQESPSEGEVGTVLAIYERIYNLSLEELLVEADITNAATGEELYQGAEAYIEQYAFSADEIDNARKIEVYLKTFAYRFVDRIIKSGNEDKENWHGLASYIWGRIDNQLGGIEKIQGVVDSCTEEETPLLEGFLAAIRDTSDFERWGDNIHDAYFEFKKVVLLKAKPNIALDPEWNIHRQEGANSTYYADLLNNRVLSLWKLTTWGKTNGKLINYLRSEHGESTYASWFHPDGNALGDRIKESCYYLISRDGVAIVREHNECLHLTNEQDLLATAMTIIQDVMGTIDMNSLSETFYQKVVSSDACPQNSSPIKDSATRAKLIDAMVNEWIVNCYCVPDDGDAPPEVKKKEYEAMTDEELIDECGGFDENYSIEQYIERYEQIPDGYMKVFDPSVDDLQGASNRERSIVYKAVDLIKKLRS